VAFWKRLKRFHIFKAILVVAFLVLRHNETLSSIELTLFQSTSRCIGKLFNSLSNTVRRQSSIASLIAVIVKIEIRGTELRPGLTAPKIGNI
jgi:hypothetical protein